MCEKRKDGIYHEYIRSLSPALRSCHDLVEFTLRFSTICRQDRSAYANAAERLLMAIGGFNMVDTAQNPDFPDSFSNRYCSPTAFEEFYGMEDAIEQIALIRNMRRKGWKRRSKISICWDLWGGKIIAAERLEMLMQSACQFMF